jgi:hypothetical protein
VLPYLTVKYLWIGAFSFFTRGSNGKSDRPSLEFKKMEGSGCLMNDVTTVNEDILHAIALIRSDLSRHCELCQIERYRHRAARAATTASWCDRRGRSDG